MTIFVTIASLALFAGLSIASLKDSVLEILNMVNARDAVNKLDTRQLATNQYHVVE